MYLACIIHKATVNFKKMSIFIDPNPSSRSFLFLQSVYSPSDENIASHLARSSSARGGPRFSLDLATCFALFPLNGESS